MCKPTNYLCMCIYIYTYAYEHVFVYHVVNTRINLQFLDASYHPFLVKLAMENTRTHTHTSPVGWRGNLQQNPIFQGKHTWFPSRISKKSHAWGLTIMICLYIHIYIYIFNIYIYICIYNTFVVNLRINHPQFYHKWWTHNHLQIEGSGIGVREL